MTPIQIARLCYETYRLYVGEQAIGDYPSWDYASHDFRGDALCTVVQLLIGIPTDLRTDNPEKFAIYEYVTHICQGVPSAKQ